MDLHMSSSQVLKRHGARCVSVRNTDSAIGGVCWTSILRLGVFYIGSAYRVVYISGWPASSGRPGLLQRTYDITNIVRATVLPPFWGEERSSPRSAFLQFGTTDDARTALRKLDGRKRPGGAPGGGTSE